MELFERIYKMKQNYRETEKECKNIQERLEDEIESIFDRLEFKVSFELEVTSKRVWLEIYGVDGDFKLSSVVIGELQKLVTGKYQGQYSLYSQNTGSLCIVW